MVILRTAVKPSAIESREPAGLEQLLLALGGDRDTLFAFCENALIADIADWMPEAKGM